MGSRELLAGFLWRARAGIRLEGTRLRAGHGMADPGYRPPYLPYASVVGPLCIELEPERDQPRAVFLPVQTPGYLRGVERGVADLVPPSGPVSLRADGDVTIEAQVDLGPLTGLSMTAPGVGAATAQRLQDALRAGPFLRDGVPVVDADRLVELGAVTARWHASRRLVVVSSGRRGVVDGGDLLARQPSSMEATAAPSATATALGLGAAALAAPGRVVRHRRPTPTAVAIDVRVDVWAGTQSELASVMDAWTRSTATRGQLLVRPAVLAADVAPGSNAVRLLAPAEPASRTTLALLDVVDGEAVDRVTGHVAVLTGGAQVTTAIEVTGNQRAELDFFELPPVPVAWTPQSPTTHGYAVTLGLRMPAGALGDTTRVLTVTGQGRTALALTVVVVADGGGTAAELRASADRADAGTFLPAVARVPSAALAAGLTVHVVLDSRRGSLALAVDGEPVAGAGAGIAGPPVGGAGMRLVLGAVEGGPANDGAAAVGTVHVHGAPVGAPDPRLAAHAAPASAWSPGDTFSLARTTDGITTSGDAVTATVLGVQGDTLVLDRPVPSAFPRATTVAYLRGEFFSQRSLRRSDDLMNQLYRMTAEYRVSTFLDEGDTPVSAPLVETVDVQVPGLAQYLAELAEPGEPVVVGGRPASGAPGTSAVFTTNPPRHPRTAGTSTTTTPAAPPESTEESHG